MEGQGTTRLEPLGGGLHIYTTKACNYGTDAVLLADFSMPQAGERSLDLGTGSGIIPLLWHKQQGLSKTVGVEIQPEACQLAEKSIRRNDLACQIEIVNADLCFLPVLWRDGFDLIACNPPYFPADSRQSPCAVRATARGEGLCRLKDVVHTARRLLRPGGRFCVCQRPQRLEELALLLRAEGLHLTRLRYAFHSRDREPFLLLAEAAEQGSLQSLPPLFLYDGGVPSAEYRRIYKDFL